MNGEREWEWCGEWYMPLSNFLPSGSMSFTSNVSSKSDADAMMY